MKRYNVESSHYARGCHEETCCCSTDFVIVELEYSGFVYNGNYDSKRIYCNVDSMEEGIDLCGTLNEPNK